MNKLVAAIKKIGLSVLVVIVLFPLMLVVVFAKEVYRAFCNFTYFRNVKYKTLDLIELVKNLK